VHDEFMAPEAPSLTAKPKSCARQSAVIRHRWHDTRFKGRMLGFADNIHKPLKEHFHGRW